MNARIEYSKKAKKFLSKNSNVISKETVEELLIIAARVLFYKENLSIDFKKIKGSEQVLYRIRKGKIRIIFKVFKNDLVILTVEDIGFRGDIY